MTIKGNVMVCDECRRQVSMPMERESAAKQSLNERVEVLRRYGVGLATHREWGFLPRSSGCTVVT